MKASTSPMRKQTTSTYRAFTLVELMVTVAVIGLVLGTVIPYTGNEWRRQRVNSVVQDLAGWILQIRAASERLSSAGCIIQFASDGNYNAGQILAEIKPSSSCIGKIPEESMRVPAIVGGDTIAFKRTDPELQFTPRGTSTNTSELIIGITLLNQTPQRCVRISPLVAMVRTGTNNTSSSPSGNCSFSDVSPF